MLNSSLSQRTIQELGRQGTRPVKRTFDESSTLAPKSLYPSPGELSQTSDKSQGFPFPKHRRLCDLDEEGLGGSSRSFLILFPCTLSSACPEQERGHLGKEEIEGGREGWERGSREEEIADSH